MNVKFVMALMLRSCVEASDSGYTVQKVLLMEGCFHLFSASAVVHSNSNRVNQTNATICKRRQGEIEGTLRSSACLVL